MLENKEEVVNIKVPNETKKVIDIKKLRDTEQSILNYMLVSTSNFIQIRDTLSENDFTFLIHKIIFKYLLILQTMFLDDGYADNYKLGAFIEALADIVQDKENVRTASVLHILSDTPSANIEKDLAIINNNSMEKEIEIYNKKIQRDVTIETIEGVTEAYFINDRLISVRTTNIAKLPSELHDNFGDTLNSCSSLDLRNDENEATAILNNESGEMESFYLKKDISELKCFNNLYRWADKFNLDEDTFPRDKESLQELFELDVSKKNMYELPKEIEKLSNLRILILDENNIKEFPNTLYKLKKLCVLSFSKNSISFISEEISNLENLVLFDACENNIAELPMSFYKLTKLEVLCLHANKLTTVANEIANLSSLISLSLSNNDIKNLPASISKLNNLKSLDIQNTKITNLPKNLLKLKNIDELSINGNPFPFIAKNIQYLNIDTLNALFKEFEELLFKNETKEIK